MRRLISGLVLPLLLVGLSGCGGGGAAESQKDKPIGTIDDVSVTGSPEATPKIDFSAPLAFKTTERKIVEAGPGSGPAINQFSLVTMDYLGVNASDGATIDSSYDRGRPETFKPSDVIKGFFVGLRGAHSGDRVLITVTPTDGYDPTGNQTTVRTGDSLVFVVDVVKVVNPMPESDLPSLVKDKDGNPKKFVAKASTPASVRLLGRYTVKPADGATVGADDSLTVEYVGQVWPDGAIFDETYSKKAPVTISLSAAIDGWKQGLVGATVGSRVILAIPSELAYGSTGRGQQIPPDSDLIFVIDIVAAE